MFTSKLIAVSAFALHQASAIVLSLNEQTGIPVPVWPYPSGDVNLGNTQLILAKNFKF